MERLAGGQFRTPGSKSLTSVDGRCSGVQMYIESMGQQLLLQKAIRSRTNQRTVSAFSTSVPTKSGQSSSGSPHPADVAVVPLKEDLLPNQGQISSTEEAVSPYFPNSATRCARCALGLSRSRIPTSECCRPDIRYAIHPTFPTQGYFTCEAVSSSRQCPAHVVVSKSRFKRQLVSAQKRAKSSQLFHHKAKTLSPVAEVRQTSDTVTQRTDQGLQGTSPHAHTGFLEECQTPTLYKQAEAVQSGACPSIRANVKTKLKSSLVSGRVTQVCGPPMAGKSNLVEQVIQELKVTLPNGRLDGLIYHSFGCKRLSRVDDVLATIITSLQPHVTLTPNLIPQKATETYVMSQVQKRMVRFSRRHHVFVFHKCESLRSSGRDLEFLTFLSKLNKLGTSENVVCSVVFTTYKRFPISGLNTETVQVGFLMDPVDIKSLLEFYAPGVNVADYIEICQRLLCVPEAVVRLAEEYLVNGGNECSAEQLETRVCTDKDFLSMVFEKRFTDVDGWLSQSDLDLLAYFSSSINSSFSEEHLVEFLRHHINGYRFDHRVSLLLRRLHDNHVLRPVPGNRFAIHPLLVYYAMKCHTRCGKAINDQSCNSFTTYLGHVLKNADKNIRLHGKKGRVFASLAHEWPNVRHVLELAITCTSGTYNAFLKVAVQARRLLMLGFPNESKDFYGALLLRAREHGTPLEQAVLEACLGQLMASGHEINWTLAEKHLDSAIDLLRTMGASYFYKLALVRKATILYKQGDYPNSLEYFERSRKVVDSCLLNQSDMTFSVSEQQREEDEITAQVFQTVPMIFLGDNKTAREMLISLLEVVNDRCPYHPDLSMLLNNIGLTEQRGNKDLTTALNWYLQAYTERNHLEKICPHEMVAPLNNIGMCLFRLNKLECGKMYLEKALMLQQESGGFLYYLALTKAHLAEISFKQRKFLLAYEQSLEAEKTLKKITRHHDFRLEVLMALVHYRIVLRQSPPTVTDCETTTSRFVRSAEEFLEYALDIGSGIKELLSDEGQHYMMTAFEHGMVMSLRNSRDKFLRYKNGYLLFVQEKKWVRDLLVSNKEDPALAAKHRRFYYYVRDREYDDLELFTCVSHMTYACSYCQNVVESFSDTMWQDEISYLMSQR